MPAPKPHTNFADRLIDLVRLIPAGRVTTYGALAAAAGRKGSARMVGWLLYGSRGDAPALPAHRVVNRQGLLTGHHQFGPGVMAERLMAEGVPVADNQVQDFGTYFWDPALASTESF